MIKTKIVSSLEKVFVDQKTEDFKSLSSLSVLKGERFSFQLIYEPIYDASVDRILWDVKVDGALAKYITTRNVINVPVTRACYPALTDENYLRTAPGLYPDVLQPLHYGGKVATSHGACIKSIWLEAELPVDVTAGEYEISVSLSSQHGTHTETLKVEVIDATLPEFESFKYTDWFHCDSLATYYNVDVWSERHWEIVENFAKAAVKCGVNLLLTPLFTPALDTAIGGERLTNQLVGVTKTGDEYAFDFSLVDRWIDMCDRVGIKYFEICHLFTQWGAHHAPKVMATVDGEYKKIFGWETDATDPEYTRFLRTFLPEFLNYMKKKGRDKDCLFHISDEPTLDHLESYKAAKNSVADLLEGYTIMDALSRYPFYEQGIVSTAIPANNHIEPFLEHSVPNLWTYYCCSQTKNVSNRFLAHSLSRTRSIGMQMYKYDIVGFLHWGFNFYQNCHSVDPVNPYLNGCGDDWVVSGDTCIVYPAQDGTAYESMRAPVFYDALQDMRAMQLCEKYYSKEEIVAGMEKVFGGEIRFDKCAEKSDVMLGIREFVNGLIKKAVSK